MQDAFIIKVASVMERAGYGIDLSPRIPGTQAMLHAWSKKFNRLGFARCRDYFLFIDWGNSAFGRLDQLLEDYRHFSAYVNHQYRIPPAWRMSIPNLALVALSPAPFPGEVVQYVQNNVLTPPLGGETGQIILIDLENKAILSPASYLEQHSKVRGALPMWHTIDLFETIRGEIFQAEV